MSVITKDIIFAYLAGQGTILQKRQIDAWLLEQGSAEIFCQCLEEWENLHPQYTPDLTGRLEDFSRYVESDDLYVSAGIQPKARSRIIRVGISVAAAAAVVVLLLAVFRDEWFYKQYRTGNAEVKVVELPDHSLVTLNANSLLRVRRFFSVGDARYAGLTGEAAFDIRHTPDDKPFIVGIPGKVEIQVLGTEFNVYARNNNPKIFLNRGSIRLNAIDSSFKSLLVKPGEMVYVDSGHKVAVNRSQSFTQVSAWKDHVFVFDRTSLDQVARMLEEQFGNKVCIADSSLGHRVISGSCKWNKEEDILSTLSLMMKFNVYQANDTILLK